MAAVIKLEPQILLENSFQNVKKFAEILYKCKLCTSLPSILTSEESFLSHMNYTHLQDSDALKKCRNCKLKFRTKEDLWSHKKLMHSDFTSEDENSSEENEFEIAWQITTDHVEFNGIDTPKRKKGRKEKNNRRQKKAKNIEEVEQDPHVVIAHGVEQTISPSSPNDSANLLKLTNQIASDASPTRSLSNNLVPCSTSEFGKYTKLIREGGNIIYFCQVCNWKSQMKVMFTEHCNGSSHLVKVTIAEQNDCVKTENPNPNESSLVKKYGKRGHFMSFLDEKINYYINKRLSNESITSEGDVQENNIESNKESREGTNDSSSNDDNVMIVEAEQERQPKEVPKVVMEMETNAMSIDSNDKGHSSNIRKRKVVSRLKDAESKKEDDWSDDSDIVQQPTSSKVSRKYIELTKLSEKIDIDSKFKIQVSSSQFPPIKLNSLEKDESRKSEINDKSSDLRLHAVESESPQIKSEEQNIIVDDESERSENIDNKEIKKIAEANAVKPSLTDYISKTVESELYRSSMYMYRCSLCPFVCNDITEYRVHFESEHEPDQTDYPTETAYSDCKTEQWKVQRIRELLPEILVAHPRGNVSRDLLLQKVGVMVNEPEISTWGPACNKALRELYPDSLAQRKGKFKKTYFFGVALIEQVQQEQEAAQNASEGNDVDFSPLRDMTQDMDRILQHLHTIVRWRGDMEAGVSRDDVLHILGRKIDDSEVQHWGIQCNRAIRILFPHVQMKRKGKYKTTVYFGVTFSNQVSKEDFASLTAPKPKVPKPSMKDDGIKPKLTWRDAIRTMGGKAFSTQDKKSTVTRGWGPMLTPGGASGLETKESSASPGTYMQDTPNPAPVPPNITSEQEELRSESPFSGRDQANSSPQNMSLLRYHLTSDEFNMYYKFGSDLAKTVWQSKDQLMAAKENNGEKLSDATIEHRSVIKQEISDNTGDEKSNDADDENSQSTIGDERSSPIFTQKSRNPNVVETQDGIMYIKREVESDQEG